MDAAIQKAFKKGTQTLRISDANTPADLAAALRGGGMFDTARIVVLNGVCANEEMKTLVVDSLSPMKGSTEAFFMLEDKLDAATRKQVEKYAEASERFDAPKGADRGGGIFALANALKRGDKKALWVGYQRELAADAAPEAIHGVLFWGAKDMLMKSHGEKEASRARNLLASLAELPHEARRRGEELEYALERFVLSGL